MAARVDEPLCEETFSGSGGAARSERSILHAVGEEKGMDLPSLSRRRSAAHLAPIVAGSIALRLQK